jgi:CBS domain-containing protein
MMTTDPACCTPETTAREAALLVREHDCGCIPVVEGDSRRLVGVVTDRDIACRCVAEGKGAETPILRAAFTPLFGALSCLRVETQPSPAPRSSSRCRRPDECGGIGPRGELKPAA